MHNPPRFSIAGELYGLDFYRALYRVLRRDGKLFHYTGEPWRHSNIVDSIEQVSMILDGTQGHRVLLLKRARDGQHYIIYNDFNTKLISYTFHTLYVINNVWLYSFGNVYSSYISPYME